VRCIPAAAGLLAAICVLGACGEEADRGAHGRAAAATRHPLAGEVVYAGDSLGMPHLMSVSGEYLLVADIGGGAALHVLREGRLIASFGRKGQGPGEFSAIRTIQPTPDGRNVWLYDPGNTRLTLLDLEAVVSGRENAVAETVILRSNLLPMNAVRLSDTLIASSGLFTGGRLALFAATGDLRRVVGALPPTRDGVPVQVAQHAYTGTLVRHPERPLLALATRHADRLEFYDLRGDFRRIARGPVGFEPVYQVQSRGGVPFMATGDDLRFGYVDLVAAGDRLYALFSGHTRAERPGRANFGQQVHVFDWEGRLVQVMELDEPVLSLAVEEEERTLYTVRHDPQPAIVRYRIAAPTK
jgi:hypothetical protein